MPTLSSILRIGFYWLLWMLVMRKLSPGLHGPDWPSTAGWIVLLTAIAAWFTWVRLHDDRLEQRMGQEAAQELLGGSPDVGFLRGGLIVAGALAAFILGLTWREGRSALWLVSGGLLVLAVWGLFSGAGGRSQARHRQAASAFDADADL